MSSEQRWTLGISATGVLLAILGSFFTVGMATGSYNHRLTSVEKAVEESRKAWNRVEGKVDDLGDGLIELGTYLDSKSSDGRRFFDFRNKRRNQE